MIISTKQKKHRRVKPQSLKVIYEQSADISPEEAECRLEHAFGVLFEETLKNMSMKHEYEQTGAKT